MTEPQFKRGDHVQYDGAGPVMQVVLMSGSLCYCRWLDATGQEQHGTFDCNKLNAWTAPAPRPPDAAT